MHARTHARTHALITAIENTAPKKVLLVVVVLLLLAPAAHAGIADSPLPPSLPKHVYSVSGVINDGGLGTFFSCTNADSVSVTVGVEVFGPAGAAPLNNPAATAISVAAGATVIFGTDSAVGLSPDASLAPGVVKKGSARVLATSTKLVCTAWVADKGTNPPSAGWTLATVKKATQKGD